MSKFQTILLVVFGAFILIAVMIFSFSRGSSGTASTVTIWGDIPASDWNTFSIAAGLTQAKDVSIFYEEKKDLIRDFTEALAEERGPDLIILSQAELWQERNRLLVIPYSSISERDFKSTFVEAGELFLSPEGIYAMPLYIDPMVLYYNRDLLTRAGIAKPLSYWDEVYTATTKLTERDSAGNVRKSVMALGEAVNIPHYKEIVSLLMLQAGTPITAYEFGSSRVTLAPRLSYNPGLPLAPADAALDFYTQFSNPAKAYYSWNRSLLSADTHFTAGDSAYYIGFASELKILRAKNPTLNFAVSAVPQSRVSDKVVTYGDIRGVAISRGTKNPAAAVSAATKLISRETANALSSTLLLPPARRDLLSTRPTDSVYSVFWDASLQARGWLDPDKDKSEVVFKEMIESVTSGRQRVSEAVRKADEELERLAN